jgi:hypothetical protein
MHDRYNMIAVRALSNLCSLALYDHDGARAGAYVLHALMDSLPQLTRLQLGMVSPEQLSHMGLQLAPKLQQVHVHVDIRGKVRTEWWHAAEQRKLLAAWLKQHGHTVSTLEICDTCLPSPFPRTTSAWGEVAAVFQDAAATAATSTAAVDAPAVSSKGWQLQSLAIGELETNQLQQLLQHLPAHSLTQLRCSLAQADTDDIIGSLLSQLSRLTALRSIDLILPKLDASGDRLLAPLSSLQQVTALQVRKGLLRRMQLQHLQLPLLQQLRADIGGGRANRARADQLQLAHLEALTQLSLKDRTGVLSPAEQLPPHLHELTLRQVEYHHRDEGSKYSLQPLLVLSRLEKLQLCMRDGAAAAAEQLAQLTSISSLTEVELSYAWELSSAEEAGQAKAAAEAAAVAWLMLPLKALSWSSTWVSGWFDFSDSWRCAIPAAVLHVVGSLQGLTKLELCAATKYSSDLPEPAQLAAMLQPLTGLQQLKLTSSMDVINPGWDSGACEGDPVYAVDALCEYDGGSVASVDEVPGFEVDAVAALLRSIGGLGELGDVCMHLQMPLTESAVTELSETVQQLLPQWLVPHCQVDVYQLKVDTGARHFF